MITVSVSQITKGRTVFIIAHRLAAIRTATRIITIEGGRIAEERGGRAPLASEGKYARKYKSKRTLRIRSSCRRLRFGTAVFWRRHDSSAD